MSLLNTTKCPTCGDETMLSLEIDAAHYQATGRERLYIECPEACGFVRDAADADPEVVANLAEYWGEQAMAGDG